MPAQARGEPQIAKEGFPFLDRIKSCHHLITELGA